MPLLLTTGNPDHAYSRTLSGHQPLLRVALMLLYED